MAVDNPDFESFMAQIMDWNYGGNDVSAFIAGLPTENLIEYANTYAKFYRGQK